MQKTISVECPHCGEGFVVVEAEAEQQQNGVIEEEDSIKADLVSWEEVAPTDPYSGNDTEIPTTQRVKADIRIDGEVRSFTYWYTPDFEYFSFVVRGQLETGTKSQNGYTIDEGVSLTNRGVPRNSDKNWTYLDMEDCRRRSNLAGLGDVIEDPENEDKDNRYRILLDEEEQPLIENEEVSEELMLKLAKGLVVFKTAS